MGRCRRGSGLANLLGRKRLPVDEVPKLARHGRQSWWSLGGGATEMRRMGAHLAQSKPSGRAVGVGLLCSVNGDFCERMDGCDAPR